MHKEVHSDILFVSAEKGQASLLSRAGDLIFTGGGIAADPVTGIPAEVLPLDGYPNHWSRINRELGFIYGRMSDALAVAGSSLDQTLRINSFHAFAEDVYESLRVRPDVFGDNPPASTLVLVPEIPVAGGRVALDTIALAADSGMPREPLVTSTPGAPMPPHERIWGRRIYSKSVRGGGFIFTSGRTNNVIGSDQDLTAKGIAALPYSQDRAEVTTRMILSYLKDSLASFGADFGHVVKAEIHLGNLDDIAGIDRVWKDAFPDNPPARIFVPTGFPTTYSSIEIEFIAIDPLSQMDREQIGETGIAPARGHEPLAVRAGPYIFFSGLSAQDGLNGLASAAKIDPAYPHHQTQARCETAWLLDEVSRIMGSRKWMPLRRRAMMPDLTWLPHINSEWISHFGLSPPTTDFLIKGGLPIPSTGVQFDLICWAE